MSQNPYTTTYGTTTVGDTCADSRQPGTTYWVQAQQQQRLNPLYYLYQATPYLGVTEDFPRRPDNMTGLYDVYMIYAEDRKNPILKRMEAVIAASDEDAKIKSGLMQMIQADWDVDYLTFIVRKLGDVKVKPKPSEVKSVK